MHLLGHKRKIIRSSLSVLLISDLDPIRNFSEGKMQRRFWGGIRGWLEQEFFKARGPILTSFQICFPSDV